MQVWVQHRYYGYYGYIYYYATRTHRHTGINLYFLYEEPSRRTRFLTIRFSNNSSTIFQIIRQISIILSKKQYENLLCVFRPHCRNSIFMYIYMFAFFPPSAPLPAPKEVYYTKNNANTILINCIHTHSIGTRS